MQGKVKYIFIAFALFLTAIFSVVGVFAFANLNFAVGGDITYTAPVPPTESEEVSYLSFEYDDDLMYAFVVGLNDFSIKTITIPARLINDGKTYKVSLAYMASFYECTSLESVIIEEGVCELGNMTFYGCVNLQSVSIPNSIEDVGRNVFEGCENLSYNTYSNAIYLGNDNNPYVLLVSANSTSISSCTINENCRVIGERAFESCQSLTSISIPSSVKQIGYSAFEMAGILGTVSTSASIGENAFLGCEGIQKLILEEGVHYIDEYAFSGCENLTEVVLPNSVNYIFNGAFSGIAITSITIPQNMVEIGYEVFAGCTLLMEVNILATTPPIIYDNTFYNVSSSIAFYVPTQSVEEYISAEEWSAFADRIQGVEF